MKILLATDGSKAGWAAVAALERLRLDGRDEVRIISIVDMALPSAIDIYGGYLPDTAELEKAARGNAEKVVAESTAKVMEFFTNDAPALSAEVLFGTPESRIVETAEQIGADLIVIGSHGYNAWERLLLGSVSNSVVHHAPCSVMVVRADTRR
jgi:nucleotide-binding universal stress UspA family protein